MSYSSEVLADSPLLYLRLNETSGTTAGDSSGNSRNGTYNSPVTLNQTSLLTGDSDPAVDFSGGYVSVPYAAWQDLTTMTWEVLINADTTLGTDFDCFGRDADASPLTELAWRFRITSAGKPQFFFVDSGVNLRTVTGATTLATGTTYHIAGTFDGTTILIYVNGVVDGSTAFSGSMSTASGEPLTIGGFFSFPSTRYDGRLDEFALYSGALSGARIAAHYAAATGGGPATVSGSGSAESDATAVGGVPVIIAVPQNNRAGGRRRQAMAIAAWEPAVVAAPASVVEATAVERANAFSTPTMVGAQPTYSISEASIERATHRVLIGSVDVTWFRGVNTPQPSYQLVEPLLYGAATIALPQVSPALERLGVGALSWLKPGKRVVVQRVLDGEVVAVDYVGVIIGFDLGGAAGQSLRVQVGGEATGRAALTLRQVPIFNGNADIGRYAYGLIRDLNLAFAPHLGPTTGIKLARFGGMSNLDYAHELTARAWTRDGSQWTIMPDVPSMFNGFGGRYRMTRKDVETIHGTIYLDDTRCVGELRRDVAEEPNRIFATGITPEGMRVRNGVYPGLRKGDNPRYPMDDDSPFGEGTADEDTDTGDGVTVMLNRLQVTGYLLQRDNLGGYDADVTRAVRALQEDAADGPTFITGDMDPDTWSALFDLNVTGYSLRWSHIEPLAESPKTRKWRRSASGAVIGINPRYDRSVLPVEVIEDMGTGFTKDQMREFSKAELANSDEPNWVGVIRFPLGAYITGEHTAGDPITAGDIASTRALRPGMNLWAPLFDGGTLFHVSGVGVSADGTVDVMVDTRARDAMKVWAIIERNRRARQSPARLWLQEHRSSTTMHDAISGWDEIGGEVERTPLPGGQWTVFPVVAGQEGTVRSIRLALETPTEYVLAIFGRPIYSSRLKRLIGNPLTKAGSKRWTNETNRDALDRRNILLYVAGDDVQPCGYFPGTKGGKDEDDAAYLLTGRWEDDAGFSYHTFADDDFGTGVLYVAIYPADNTVLPAGRIMENQLETGV